MASATSKEVLAALVGFDTTSRNSNLGLLDWVENYLRQFGIQSTRILNQDGTKANLWATIGPAQVPGIVLSGHTDVVPVDGQSWTSDPFHLTERDGRLYGRGAVDMKGFVACCIAAAPKLSKLRLARPIHLAFSYDEEVGCVGVRDMITRMTEGPAKPAMCFVGEPTDMNVVIGHKGKRSFAVTVRGRACHSSLTPQGVNAVEYAARLIVKIREIADRLAQSGARDPLYDVPYTTAHTGTVQGGRALNIVPDQCVFEFEFRSIASDDVDALIEDVKRYARETLEPSMQTVAPEAGIVFEFKSGFPGLETSPNATIVTLAKELAGRTQLGKVAFGAEAGLFDKAGIPTVVIGPGSIERAHKPDEFIALAELEECSAFIDKLAKTCQP